MARAGQAAAVQRRLQGVHQPLDLYAALTDGGRKADTLLFEKANGRAIIMTQAAVRAECRGREAELTALGFEGRLVLKHAARLLEKHVVEKERDRLLFRFPSCDDEDAEKRLLAPSPYDALRALTLNIESLTKEEQLTLFAGGVIAFDHVDMFEALPTQAADPIDFPDYLFWLAQSIIVIEPGGDARIVCTAFGADLEKDQKRSHHGAVERLSTLVAACGTITPRPPVPTPRPRADFEAEVDLEDEDYAAVVSRLKRNIVAGDVYQIVPSRTFSTACGNPLDAFARQRQLDPSPYMFFVAGPRHILFGASPETSVKVSFEDGAPIVEIKPIAGTRPRGETPDADDRMEADLRLDAKETAEHMMLVDLARNDVARVSASGTRRVAKLLTVERYARVMHLVSAVTGRLAAGLDPFHALQACLNMGTLSGAPKLRAVELLRETEATKRGPYGGAVGWVSGNGEMDSAVVIRSALVKDGRAYVRAGAGVVHDSVPMAEAAETRSKASAVLSALAESEAAA
ncbi:anthranilate synthase component 1 [Sphingosinicella rhizophila]|uniref:anthranilate synthase n=1 Tax=Sphingosinicella rhizophila TaxID=3050082 RepID=A0ABU3Q1T2_9SPHN|nr:anthranilate synthase component 1 [Sphingosinicella sp. GR2756]MDT9597353.1 anthranilate synthase component 1 [Sphingosinicella sp. GR2756]